MNLTLANGNNNLTGAEPQNIFQSSIGPQNTNLRGINKAISIIEEKIFEALGNGIDVLNARDKLTQAKSAESSGDYDTARKYALEADKLYEISRKQCIVKRISELYEIIEYMYTELVDLGKLGIDVSKPQEMLKKAKRSYEKDAYDESMLYVDEASEEIDNLLLLSKIRTKLSSFEKDLKFLKARDADVSPVKELHEKTLTAIDFKNYVDAMAFVRKAIISIKKLKYRKLFETTAPTYLGESQIKKEPKLCTSCTRENPAESLFCGFCGNKF